MNGFGVKCSNFNFEQEYSLLWRLLSHRYLKSGTRWVIHRILFNNIFGKLYLKYTVKDEDKWCPVTVKKLAKIYTELSKKQEYEPVLKLYKQFIESVKQWHREKGHLVVNEIEPYIYDGLFLPPITFNDLIEYKSLKEAFMTKYPAPVNWSWNTVNVNIMYSSYNVAKYVIPLDKSRVYNIVSNLYNDESVDKSIFDYSYAKYRGFNEGVQSIIYFYYSKKFLDKTECDLFCDDCNCSGDCETELIKMYLKDYIRMSIQVNSPISLRINSRKKIKEKHDEVQLKYLAKTTTKIVIPKNSRFKQLRKMLPKHFEYINTKKRLSEETLIQHHCIASHAHLINDDEIAVYSFIYPEDKKRYTVEFRVLQNRRNTQNPKYYISQLAGYDNDNWNDENIIKYVSQYLD